MIRIIQVIDSLEAGGAEKMAVNYSNELAYYDNVSYSGIVVTRKRGELETYITNKQNYLYLNRKRIIDLAAFYCFLKHLKQNNITHIQSHSTSIYFSIVAKFFFPKIKILWHDHYGMSEYLNVRQHKILAIISPFIDIIISVNEQLKNWAKEKLKCKKVFFIPNFYSVDFTANYTKLNGVQGKRITCLANLRKQKNHFLLLKVALRIKQSHPDWSFHFVGKNFKDDYSKELVKFIEKNKLEKTVYLYDAVTDVGNVLKQSSIGVLSSLSEGLPLAILEYGFTFLPVISTKVGQISELIKDFETGFLIEVNDEETFYERLIFIIENEEKRHNVAKNLNKVVLEKYSKDKVFEQFFKLLEN